MRVSVALRGRSDYPRAGTRSSRAGDSRYPADAVPRRSRANPEDRMPEEDQSTRTQATRTIEADAEVPPQAVVRRGGTFESFRHRDFTLFWLGSLVSNTGTWMQTARSRSSCGGCDARTRLGLVNFVAGIPVLFSRCPPACSPTAWTSAASSSGASRHARSGARALRALHHRTPLLEHAVSRCSGSAGSGCSAA